MVENFITESEEQELLDFLKEKTFTKEGTRSVIQYGEHYRYMGSKTQPKEMPDVIKKLVERLNTEYDMADSENNCTTSLTHAL